MTLPTRMAAALTVFHLLPRNSTAWCCWWLNTQHIVKMSPAIFTPGFTMTAISSAPRCIVAIRWPQITRAKKNKPQNVFRSISPGIFWGRKYFSCHVSQFHIHSPDFIKLAFEVYLSNFIAPIYAAISSYYLTSSASHLTPISELLSGVFLAVTDSDRFGTLTAVKWSWMAAFNHNTALSCRQTAERCSLRASVCMQVVQREPASEMVATALCWSQANVISQR